MTAKRLAAVVAAGALAAAGCGGEAEDGLDVAAPYPFITGTDTTTTTTTTLPVFDACGKTADWAIGEWQTLLNDGAKGDGERAEIDGGTGCVVDIKYTEGVVARLVICADSTRWGIGWGIGFNGVASWTVAFPGGWGRSLPLVDWHDCDAPGRSWFDACGETADWALDAYRENQGENVAEIDADIRAKHPSLSSLTSRVSVTDDDRIGFDDGRGCSLDVDATTTRAGTDWDDIKQRIRIVACENDEVRAYYALPYDDPRTLTEQYDDCKLTLS